MARRALVLGLALGLLAGIAPARASVPSCDGLTFAPTAGAVATTECDSDALGGITPLSYYVPERCTTDARCPVLYLLHGFGGDHRAMLGTASAPSSYVRALTEDPVTGEALDELAFILISPDGRTVPAGADAPPAGQESFWVDWNPRYWSHPPQFERHVTEELRELVERSFPAIATRAGRGILGVSLGGFGAFKLALQHPHLYSSAGSVSGALNILVAPGPQPVPHRVGASTGPQPDLGYRRLPRIATTPPGFPFGDPFGAFGDPGADEAYYRGNNPLDLAMNGTGVGMRFIHNDTIPRSRDDFAEPAGYIGAQALETVVMPMNLEMTAALTQHGLPYSHAIHPGLHSGRYWDPHVRSMLEWHLIHMSQQGKELPPFAPERFNFRSIRDRFSVWGWDVEVTGRAPEEFVTLVDVSRAGLTVHGTGRIRITSPAIPERQGIMWALPPTGGSSELTSHEDGVKVLEFDLGAPSGTDEHAGASGAARAQTAHFCFFDLAGPAPRSCP